MTPGTIARALINAPLIYPLFIFFVPSGHLRVVEIGDGQVSDLVGWTPERFANILAERFQHRAEDK